MIKNPRDHDFDDFIDFLLTQNPAGLSDVWLKAARVGWEGRKEFELHPKGTWVKGEKG